MNFLSDLTERLLCFLFACLVWVVGAVVLSVDWIIERITFNER